MTEHLPEPTGESGLNVAENLAATVRLLDVLQAEVTHDRPLISGGLWFAADGSFDASVGPLLAEIADPDNLGNGYLAGLRPDGVGQIIMLEREKGGVVGRVVITLRDDAPTRLFGERRMPWLPEYGLTYRKRLGGCLAPPKLLDDLAIQFVRACDEKRARMEAGKRPRIGQIVHSLAGFVGRHVIRASSHRQRGLE